MGFIGREGRLATLGMPRTAIVSGLSRSRADGGGLLGDVESDPLIGAEEMEIDEDGSVPRQQPSRAPTRPDYRLAPDGPWNDDGTEGSDDDVSYDIVRPDLISVPLDSP